MGEFNMTYLDVGRSVLENPLTFDAQGMRPTCGVGMCHQLFNRVEEFILKG